MAARDTRASRPEGWARDWIVFGVFCIATVVLAARLVFIQVVKADDYSTLADTSHTKTVEISARRGTIYDRNGEVLASNMDATTIYADPALVTDAAGVARVLEEVLGETYDKSYADYYELVTKDNQFTYIHRKVDVDLAEELQEALDEEDLAGIYFIEDTTRVYPYGDVASQLVGNVDVDGNGIAGLELAYDELIGGEDGEMVAEQGSGGMPIADGSVEIEEATDGADIVTSIDVKLQEKLEECLLDTVCEWSADGGNATVYDAATGEIYASASYALEDDDSSEDGSDSDSADGDSYSTETGETDSTETLYDENGEIIAADEDDYTLEVGKLAALTDAYEPGSTFKAMTALSVISNGGANANTTFSVPDTLEVYDYDITDSHTHDTETMTLTDIIAESSNVGMVLASRTVEYEDLYATYAMLGFGIGAATDFPGVASGELEEASEWVPVRAANISFGQGVTVTNGQLIAAYGAIEQDGVLRTPHFLCDVPNEEETADEIADELEASSEVCDAETCETVTEMLHEVVYGEDGTGSAAQVDGFTVVGKTGTAQVAEGGVYGDTYNVSFVGWLEGSSSDLVCAVTVNGLDGESGGGTVCGPAFAEIMAFAAERYQVNPDAG